MRMTALHIGSGCAPVVVSQRFIDRLVGKLGRMVRGTWCSWRGPFRRWRMLARRARREWSLLVWRHPVGSFTSTRVRELEPVLMRVLVSISKAVVFVRCNSSNTATHGDEPAAGKHVGGERRAAAAHGRNEAQAQRLIWRMADRRLPSLACVISFRTQQPNLAQAL